MKTLVVDDRILMYEEDLPKMTDEEYSKWFETSVIVDGVRMGDIYPKVDFSAMLEELERVAMKSLSLPKEAFIPPTTSCTNDSNNDKL